MPRKKKSSLEIIIVNYNAQFWLKKTLSSLKKHYLDQAYHRVTVTVVDNASTDDSSTLVKRNFRWARLVQAEKNLGFAKANNLALEKSRTDYVMLLNSDVEFTANSNLDLLVDHLNQHSQVAVIGPKIIFTDGSLDPACHRGEPTLWAALTYFLKLETLFPKSSWFGQYHQGFKSLNQTHLVDAISGAAMMVRQAAIKQVGLLDERFFMYAEDLDWCRRFRDKGWQVVFYPAVSLIHHKYKSGLKNTSQAIARKTRKHFYNTMLQYYDKHYAQSYPGWVRKLVRIFITIKKGAL